MQNTRALALRAELSQIEKAEEQAAFRERAQRYRAARDQCDEQAKLVQELDREIGELRKAKEIQAPFVSQAREALRQFEFSLSENEETPFRSSAEIAADDARRRKLQHALDGEVAKAAELGRLHANLFPGQWIREHEKLNQLNRLAEQLRPLPRKKDSGSGLFYVS
jgi:hypothetical protein